MISNIPYIFHIKGSEMADALKHVGIIPDGNRRFAKRLMKKPWKGHEWGMEKVKNVLRWLEDTEVDTVTIYALSWENLNKRPEKEFKFLMELFKEYALEMKDLEEVHEKEVRFEITGNYIKLPDEVVKALEELENRTNEYDNYKINLAIAYSGRKELVHSFKEIQNNGGKVSEESIKKHLWINESSPDLIIRTGGEKRLSNFLTWQSAYSELYFMEKMWPEVEKEDIMKAVREYRNRERRFGE